MSSGFGSQAFGAQGLQLVSGAAVAWRNNGILPARHSDIGVGPGVFRRKQPNKKARVGRAFLGDKLNSDVVGEAAQLVRAARVLE
ncbi:MAG: hypothetical protein OEW36_13655, partial [Hylemonella sp.]|nr:hypothetical protein [Hylemonella sp.]